MELKRINPKGMTIEEMFGSFDEISHEHKEGLFTQEFRAFSNMPGDKKKWILFDGPIDFDWVENLNSILDDNKKMSLPSGEQIVMADGMALLLETNNMRNVTPATVSRCGLLCLHRSECCDTKAIFNAWLRGLTPNLRELVPEIEATANFLMVEAIAVFEEEERANKLPLKAIDMHWLMQNFVRMLTAMVYDYFLEYEKSNEVSINLAANRTFLGKSLLNLTVSNTWADMEVDPNVTAYADEQFKRTGQKSQGSQRPFSRGRIETPDLGERTTKNKRLPKCSFLGDELRFENALKFTPIWVEASIIFALVWTFCPVLSDGGKKKLDERLRAKFDLGRSDFSTYQREKKKKEKEKQKELQKKTTRKITKEKTRPLEPVEPRSKDGLTFSWTDNLQVKPMLISNFPEGESFYDFYFDLDANDW